MRWVVLAILLFLSHAAHCLCLKKKCIILTEELGYIIIPNSQLVAGARTLFCTHLLTSLLRCGQLNVPLLCRSLHRADAERGDTAPGVGVVTV